MNVKQLAIISAVAMVIIGCIIAAGCTGAVEQQKDTKDNLIGFWVSNDNGQTIYQVLDNKSVTVTRVLDGVVSAKIATWSKTGNNEYNIDNQPFFLSTSGTDGTMSTPEGLTVHFIKYDNYPVPTISPNIVATQTPTPTLTPTETSSTEEVVDDVVGIWYCSTIAVPEGGSFKWQQMHFNKDGTGYVEGYDSEKFKFNKIYFAWTSLGTNNNGINQYVITTENGDALSFKFVKGTKTGKLSGSVSGIPVEIDDFTLTFT